jgi:hypothetical protein
VDEVPFTLNFADSDDYWDFMTHVAGAIAIVLDRLSNDERERVRTDIAERVTAFESVRGIDMPAVSLVAAAS